MVRGTADRTASAAGILAVLGVLVPFSWLMPASSPWPLVGAFSGIGAAAVVLGWLVPGRWSAWLWGAGSAVLLVLESAWEYDALPPWSLPYQAAAWSVAALVLGGAGAFRQGGWKEGLRAGLAGQLAASAGWAVLLLLFLHEPLQAAVLDSAGALDRYQQSSTVSFWAWVADDYWGGILLRLGAGAALGAAAGWAGGRIRGLFPPKAGKKTPKGP